MITSTAKPIAFIRDLADHLAKRFPAGAAGLNTIRQAFDANGMPEIFISHNANEAAGQPVLLIKISQVSMVSPDVFGNVGLAYTPLLLQFNYELASSGDSIVSHADMAKAEFESIKTAIRFQKSENANGTAVTDANLATATVVADLDELYWPTKNP